jgi:hypothetical protein
MARLLASWFLPNHHRHFLAERLKRGPPDVVMRPMHEFIAEPLFRAFVNPAHIINGLAPTR